MTKPDTARRMPLRAALIVWPTQLAIVHLAVPLELSRHGQRHGWQNSASRPSVTNLVGLVPLAAGAALIVWALAGHYAAAPDKSWAIKRNLAPEYLLTDGPYRLSRNPMYVAGVAIWSGWTAWLGSAPVAAGALVLTGIYRAAIVWEERTLERRWGNNWRAYAQRTSRWLPTPFGTTPNSPEQSGQLPLPREAGL